MTKQITETMKLQQYIVSIKVRHNIEIEELKAENARLRYALKLAGEFITKSDEQYGRLMADVTGCITTPTPPKQGITRFHIGGITEIVRERVIR